MPEQKNKEQISQKTSEDNVARRTGKNTLMLLFGTLFRMFVSFAFVVFAADRLGVEGFGIYSIGIHYFELFLSLSATAIGILLTRDIAKWKRRANELTTSACVFALLLAVLGALMMVGLTMLFQFSTVTSQVIMVASLALIPAALSAVLEAVLVAHERAEFVALSVSIESTIRVLASIGAILMGYGLATLFAILIITRVVQLLVFYVSVRHVAALQFSFSTRGFSRFTRRWRMFAAENWMATIYTNLDVLVLSWLTNEVAVGLYSAAWKIVRLGSVAAKTYTTAVFPLLARLHQQSIRQFEKVNMDTIRLMCVIAIPIVIVTSVLSDRIIGLVYYSGKYTDAIPVLQVLIWVLLLEFLNPFLSHTLFARGRQDRSMYVAAIALVVNTVATLALVHNFGALGAAFGTVIGGLVATICYMKFALTRSEIIKTTHSVLRVLLASCIVGLALLLVRDANWFVLGLVGLLIYPALVWMLRLVSQRDIDLLRSIVVSKTA